MFWFFEYSIVLNQCSFFKSIKEDFYFWTLFAVKFLQIKKFFFTELPIDNRLECKFKRLFKQKKYHLNLSGNVKDEKEIFR